MSEWISVKDRLSEDEGRYAIVYLKAGRFPTAFIGDYYPREGWGSWLFDEPITHWMPFPDLPK